MSTSEFRPDLENCRSKLYATARSWLPTKLRAQLGVSDLVQETFLQAHRHLRSFRGTSYRELSAWMQSILRNLFSNLWRRHHLNVDRQKISQTAPVHHAGQSAFHEETPSHLLMAQEEQDAMKQALTQLNAEERQLLARYHRDNCTFAELGKELNCSEEAARKRWARALLRWRRLVQSE